MDQVTQALHGGRKRVNQKTYSTRPSFGPTPIRRIRPASKIQVFDDKISVILWDRLRLPSRNSFGKIINANNLAATQHIDPCSHSGGDATCRPHGRGGR